MEIIHLHFFNVICVSSKKFHCWMQNYLFNVGLSVCPPSLNFILAVSGNKKLGSFNIQSEFISWSPHSHSVSASASVGYIPWNEAKVKRN